MDGDLTLSAAEQLQEHGYVPVLLRGKRPAFKDWKTPMEFRELRFWLAKYPELNLGILLSGQGLAVVDVDDPTEEWLREKNLESVQTCFTSRGSHRYFRAEGDMAGRKFPGGDLKTRGVACCPPSEHPDTGWLYRWESGTVRKELLPLLPPGVLVKERSKPVAVIEEVRGASTEIVRGIRNPEAWCLRVESVQGANGSGQLVRVVTCMRDCGRSAAETLRFLKDVWNRTCATPPWSDSELEYAVARHFKGE
jgi:hypothetical protein